MKTECPQSNYLSKFISDLGPLPETSMKVEKKSELIGRGGFYRRPVVVQGKVRERKITYIKFQNIHLPQRGLGCPEFDSKAAMEKLTEKETTLIKKK
jgi:hypothetical protein